MLNENIKTIMQKNGITKENLIEWTGFHVAYIEELLDGNIYPRRLDLKRIAEGLGVEPEILTEKIEINDKRWKYSKIEAPPKSLYDVPLLVVLAPIDREYRVDIGFYNGKYWYRKCNGIKHPLSDHSAVVKWQPQPEKGDKKPKEIPQSEVSEKSKNSFFWKQH